MSIKWVEMGEDTWALLVPGGMLVKTWEYDSAENGMAVATAITHVPGNAEEVSRWIQDNSKTDEDA